MTSSKRFLIPAVAVASALLGSGMTLIATVPVKGEAAAVREQIWANELGIYSGRGKGQLDFYVNNASPHYLGWPPTSAEPFPLATLRRDAAAMRGKTQERIKTTFKGFAFSGTTAVIYYRNDRTMRADGTPVDEAFENIHVWAREDGQWKVLGGLARKIKG